MLWIPRLIFYMMIFLEYTFVGNENNQSLIGYVDIDINDPFKIIESPEEPILGLGTLGADDNGVTASCIINHNGEKYLYYIGCS